MEEEWRPIHEFNGIDYEGKYEISSLGRLKSTKRGTAKILKPHTQHDGYVTTVLAKDGKTAHVKLHRLVAVHFLPAVDGKTSVNHIDGNKSHNKVSNLAWISQAENSAHFHMLKGNKAPLESLLKRIKNIDRLIQDLEKEKTELLRRVDERLA